MPSKSPVVSSKETVASNALAEKKTSSRENNHSLKQPTPKTAKSDKSLKRKRESEVAVVEDSKKKSHYPIIEFVAPEALSSAGNSTSSKTHATITKYLVSSICKTEALGLEKYFSTELSDSRHQYISSHLVGVLNKLPKAVSEACPPDIIFTPEVSKAERLKLDKNQRYLEELDAQLEMMRYYANNIEEFIRHAEGSSKLENFENNSEKLDINLDLVSYCFNC